VLLDAARIDKRAGSEIIPPPNLTRSEDSVLAVPGLTDAVPPSFTAWENFYVIVGSSGAALTGLQFIVIAFIAESRQQLTERMIDTFATPAIVHFCVVLFMAAVLSAPWPGLFAPAVVLGISGIAGVVYTALVLRRAHRQTGYKLVIEDWIWYTLLPFIAYAMLFSAAVTLSRHTNGAMFVIATVTLMLLFIGVHSSWDTVTYVAVQRTAAEAQRGGARPDAG
jgi:hypothetical protein